MPTYKITDPTTGKVVRLTGDSPPTEQELTEIFSKLGGPATPLTPQQPQPQPQAEAMGPAAPPDPFAHLRGVGDQLSAADDAPHTEPTPGMEGFWKGLSGNSTAKVTSQDVQDKGWMHAAGDIFSAEHAGSVLHDTGMMAAGALLPAGLRGGGAALEGVGNAVGGKGATLAMRAIAGHEMAGPRGAAAAALAPPVLKGMGRVMQRAGNALGSSPEQSPAPPSMQILPQAQAPPSIATPPAGERVATPSSAVPQTPQAPTPQAPPSPTPPAPVAPPTPVPAPSPMPEAAPPPPAASPVSMQDGAMQKALAGPAPLGSLPPGQTPRVKAWKPGYGPSAGDAATLRKSFGSKTAAQLLKTRQDQVSSLAPRTGPAQLPTQVVEAITSEFAKVPIEQRQFYIDKANNPLVRNLLLSLSR